MMSSATAWFRTSRTHEPVHADVVAQVEGPHGVAIAGGDARHQRFVGCRLRRGRAAAEPPVRAGWEKSTYMGHLHRCTHVITGVMRPNDVTNVTQANI